MLILDKVIIGLPVVLLGMFLYYKNRINPIVKKLNYLLKVKKVFIVPQSILTISFRMKLVKEKIKNISLKTNKIKEYIKILHKNKFEITNSILIKQCKYLIYLLEYYDKYCALFLNMEFHIYLEVIKIYIYGKNLINKINIDEFITRINISINKIISSFQAEHTIESRDTEDTINKIKKNINTIVGNLIMLQSNIMMKNESPINEDYLINNYKIENQLKEVFDLSKKLDEQYNLFISEIEVNEYLQNENINIKETVNPGQINKSTKKRFLRKQLENILTLWGKFAAVMPLMYAVIKKIMLIGIILAIIGSLVELYKIIGDSFSYTPALVSVIDAPIKDEEALDRIVLRLNEENVKVNVTPNGIIYVAGEDTAQRMRTILLSENLIPDGIEPWAVFNTERWSITDFERNVYFRTELARMISDHIKTIEDISDANVFIYWPERELFYVDQKPVTASVIIIPKIGSDITKNRKKIEGIQKILKFAVEGLDYENIIISDQNGLILNNFE